jgi:hypothetical protein
MFSNFSKSINYKYTLFPLLASVGIFKLNTKSNSNSKSNKIVFCGGNHDDEEKVNTGRSISHRVGKIEQKLDFLIGRENVKIDLKDYPKFNKNSDSLLKRILDEGTWKRNHMLKTDEGYTINDLIQAGLDTPDHPIGLVSPSKDAYYTFEEILVNAASRFHNRNLKLSRYEKEDYPTVKNILNSTEDLLNSIIETIEITTHRNVDGYAFSSKISRFNRRELARNILQVLKSEESQIFEETGKFLSLENKDLFSSQNQNPFYRSCGFYRDWPDGRFIYVNNEQTLTLMVNEEDHLKIIQRVDDSSKVNKVKNLLNYFDLLDRLQNKLNFCFDENLGYLNSFVNNLGSATYFKIKIKVPENKIEEFKNYFKNNSDVEVNGINDSVEISNVTSFYNFSKFLIDLISAKNILVQDK